MMKIVISSTEALLKHSNVRTVMEVKSFEMSYVTIAFDSFSVCLKNNCAPAPLMR
jgi:hypothetical protein